MPGPNVACINDPIYLQYRNMLYWDKAAMAVAPGDPAATRIYHWLHLKDDVNAIAPIVESEKPALGSRVYYVYPNEANTGWEGEGTSPSTIACCRTAVRQWSKCRRSSTTTSAIRRS